MKEEKYNEAIQCYTKAMELDSANAVFPCNRFVLINSNCENPANSMSLSSIYTCTSTIYLES